MRLIHIGEAHVNHSADPRIPRAIERLATADSLTLVAGAGVSMESGLPSWNSLVNALVRRVGQRYALSDDDLDAFVAWAGTEGAPVIASIARTGLSPEMFLGAIRSELYGGETTFAPGGTAEAITQVRLAFGPGKTRCATTNYDCLLELAAKDAISTPPPPSWPSLMQVRTLIDDEESPAELAVRHLHGVLHPDGTTVGEIVLAEGDYHLMQEPGQWQEEWFVEQLAHSTVAFIGLSLTDPNLLRYLYRARDRTGGLHVAVFSRQDGSDRYGTLSAATVDAYERATDARWLSVQVMPVRCDYYAQSAQLLFEVAARRRLGTAYTPLSQRLEQWEQEVGESTFTRVQPRFNELQDELQDLLAAGVRAILTNLGTYGIYPGDGERVQMSLWLYRPSDDSLVNWCSSDRAWRAPETMEPVAVEWDSPYASVRAFCSGSIAEHSTHDQVATRWNHVVGVPLWFDEEPWGRLPVGVFTLASTASITTSVLARGLATLRTETLPGIVVPALALLFRP